MHPVNKLNFGANGIAVTFNSGTSTLQGYIVKQLSQSRYVVTDGTTVATIRLAVTAADAASLPAGMGTIVVTPAGGPAEHVHALLSRKVRTIEGNTYMWNLTGATAAGEALVTTVAAAAASAAAASAASAAAAAATTAAASAAAAAAPAAPTTPTGP